MCKYFYLIYIGLKNTRKKELDIFFLEKKKVTRLKNSETEKKSEKIFFLGISSELPTRSQYIDHLYVNIYSKKMFLKIFLK